MKKIFSIQIAALALLGFNSCTKSDFSDTYADPSKVAVTTVDKQFSGFITSYIWGNSDKGQHGYVVPTYWDYFVVLRTTMLHYTQAVGWENGDNQYVPGAASITDRWNDYYYTLSQYRELETIYGKLSTAEQTELRFYMILATIFLYDQTQKIVDLHGNIPWTEAGKLSANRNDYKGALAKYDDAATIYTKMLDDLKGFSTELNSITIRAELVAKFKTQDLVNRGDLTLWKKYCNSLRLRMLTRVSGVASFQSRVNTEIAQILAAPATYPIVLTNDDNVKVSVFDFGTDITAKGFRDGLESSAGNTAGKVMIDHMKANGDPRLRALFEPGANAAGAYTGLDQTLNRSTQNALIAGGTLAIYNRSTVSRNQYFPGMIMTAAEVNFLLAEYYLKAANDAAAKTAYETGIAKSIEYYYWLRTFSKDNTSPALVPTNATEVNNYIASAGVNWNNAATTPDKLKLIATQKWLHYSVVQPVESWAENRRLDAPVFSFETDNSSNQKQPPVRWVYPSAEQTFNPTNYEAVKANDKLTVKLFWDIQ
jgi:hypothetical protein